MWTVCPSAAINNVYRFVVILGRASLLSFQETTSLWLDLPVRHFRLKLTTHFWIWNSFWRRSFDWSQTEWNWVRTLWRNAIEGSPEYFCEIILCNRRFPLAISACIWHHLLLFQTLFQTFIICSVYSFGWRQTQYNRARSTDEDYQGQRLPT